MRNFFSRKWMAALILFMLTSSCEDKKYQEFGTLSLSFEYTPTVVQSSSQINQDTTSKDNNNSPIRTFEGIEDLPFKNGKSLSNEMPSMKSIESPVSIEEITSELLQDYSIARITINNGTPVSINLGTTTSYNRTVPIGTALVKVELLSGSTVLYQSSKSVQIQQDQSSSVTFKSTDWTVENQEISITDGGFSSEVTIGQSITFTWTNTHAARPVRIQMIQGNENNVISTLDQNFTGLSYTYNTNGASPANNLGFKVVSTIQTSTSSSVCCFDLVNNNSAPVVNNVNDATDEDNSVEIQLDGDDDDGDSLTYIIVSNPSNGSLGSISSDKITYAPNQDFFGTDTFTYKASDGTSDSNTATVTVIINPINDPPVTKDVSGQMDENRFSRTAEILLDISDVDEDNLTVSLVTEPSNGQASIASTNEGFVLFYDPNQDWNGEESFTYKANDGQEDSNISSITITVDPVNDPPVVVGSNDSSSGGSLEFDGLDDKVEFDVDWSSFEGYTTNTQSEGDGIEDFTLSLWVKLDEVNTPYYFLDNQSGNNDLVALNINTANELQFYYQGNGGYRSLYTNNPLTSADEWYHLLITRNYHPEDDGFTQGGPSGSAGNGCTQDAGNGVRLYINGQFHCSRYDGGTRYNWNQGLQLGLGNDNDQDFDGNMDGFAIWDDVLSPAEIQEIYELGRSANLISNSGNYNSSANLELFYDFNQGSGTILEDKTGNTSQNGTISGAVFSVGEILIETDEDLFTDIDLMDYVSDVDGDNLIFSIVSEPQHGTTSFVSNSILRYQPDTDYNGQDTFTWKANDGTVDSATSTVIVTINAQDELSFSFPSGDEIIKYGDQVTFDWNIHPFNTYDIYLQQLDLEGDDNPDVSPVLIAENISLNSDKELNWNQNLVKDGGNSFKFWKLKFVDQNSLNEFESQAFKLLPSFEVQINGSSDSSHNVKNNKLLDLTFHWGDDLQKFYYNYDIKDLNGNIVIRGGIQGSSAITEGVATNQNSTMNICDTDCNERNNGGFSLPVTDKLFENNQTYILSSYLADWWDYSFYLVEQDTFTVQEGNSITLHNRPENRDYAYYDRIPISFSTKNIDNVRIRPLTNFPNNGNGNSGFYDLGGYYSASQSIKTVNLDPPESMCKGSPKCFTDTDKDSKAFITVWDKDFMTNFIQASSYIRSGPSLVDLSNQWSEDEDYLLYGDEHIIYPSDTLHINLFEPYIDILSPEEGSVVNIGDNFTVNYQTYGMRDATIDFVIERAGSEVYRRENLENSGVYKFEKLFLENISEGGNPFLGESKEHEIWIYATNSTKNSNIDGGSREHRIQDYKFTIDATQVNDPVVKFPNGGENLIIGNTYNIEWNFEDIADSLTLSLQRIGPGDIQYSTRVRNDGNHPLTIPNVATDFPYKVILESEFGSFRDFSDNSFNIVQSSSSTTYGGDVSYTLTSEFLEHNIEVSENGSISDLSVTVSLEGDRSDHLRFIELYLISPQGTRVLLAGGDQMPNNHIRGSFSSSTNSLVTTVFDDNAEKDIYAGTPPYISSHRPEENLSTFFGEDQQGTWKLLVVHNATESIDISYVSLEIDTENYPGYIYEEDNGWIYSSDETTGSGQLEIPGNSTRQLLVNASYNTNTNNVIDDLDVQLQISGDRSDHLRFLSISLVDAGFNPPRKSVVLFKGDQISSGGYDKTFNIMKKLRFDDQASDTWNNNPTTLFTRIKPVEPLSSFTDTAYNSFYISVTNTASESAYLSYSFANKENSSAIFIDTRPNDSSSPSANDMSVSTNEDTALAITLDANDDIDGGSIVSYEILSQPSNGNLSSISSAGVLTYMPAYNYSGSDAFTYQVRDDDGNYSNTGRVSITVSAVDDQPNANDVSATTSEDTPVDISLTASEYDGDTYEFVIVSQPSNGTATIASSKATYTPNANFNGVDTFTFQAQDTQGRMNVATATITVNSINDIPVVEDIAVSVDEDNSIEIQLEGTDIETENLTFTIVDNVSNGTTELNGSVVTYTPDANWNGTDTFTYKANDGTVDSNIATTSITVNAVSDYVIYMHAGTTNGTGSSDNPLNNFADASAAIEQDPSTGYGTIILKPGTYISSPDNKVRINDTNGIHIKSESGDPEDTIITEDNDTGGNEFSFVAGSLIIESVTLSGIIGGVNPMAKASQDSLVLKNIIVKDNTVTSAPSHGSFEVTNSGASLKIYDSKFINNHHENDAFFKGEVTTEIFNSIFIDNSQGSNGVLFNRQSITVEDSRFIDNAPIANQITGSRIVIDNNSRLQAFQRAYLTNSFLRNVNGGSWPVSSPGEIKNSILINVSLSSYTNGGQNNYWKDFYNVKVGAEIAVHPTLINLKGSVVLNNWEDIKFLNYNPTTQTASESSDYGLNHHSPAIDAGDPEDDFSNEPAPNGGRINAGIFGNTVNAQITNSAPVTSDVFASTNEDTSINITLGGSDDDNDTLSYSVVASNNGTISLNGAVATYTPNANWNGTDTFTYKANDGLGDSNTSTVTVTVNAIDDAPTTSDINVSTDEDNAVEIPLEGADVDGDDLTYLITQDNTSNGSISIDGGTVTYNPNQDWFGQETFQYGVLDENENESNLSIVTITVNSVNDAPITKDISYSPTSTAANDGNPEIAIINEDASWSYDLTNSTTDVENDALSFLSSDSANNGSFSISGSVISYSPNTDWNGIDMFDYYANDGSLDSNVSTIILKINPVNDPPVSSNISASTNEDTSVNITLQVADVENDNLTYAIDSDVSNGTTSLSGNVVTYTPNTNWNGTDTFTYKANDGTDDSNTATVTITVNAVDDAPTIGDPITVNVSRSTGSANINTVSFQVDITDPDVNSSSDLLYYMIINDGGSGFQHHAYISPTWNSVYPTTLESEVHANYGSNIEIWDQATQTFTYHAAVGHTGNEKIKFYSRECESCPLSTDYFEVTIGIN